MRKSRGKAGLMKKVVYTKYRIMFVEIFGYQIKIKEKNYEFRFSLLWNV